MMPKFQTTHWGFRDSGDFDQAPDFQQQNPQASADGGVPPLVSDPGVIYQSPVTPAQRTLPPRDDNGVLPLVGDLGVIYQSSVASTSGSGGSPGGSLASVSGSGPGLVINVIYDFERQQCPGGVHNRYPRSRSIP